jgi:P27 family predicted phage terminase small subunit
MTARRKGRASFSSVRGGGAPKAIPVPPGDLDAAGVAVWETAWALSRVEEADAVTVARLCRLEDEAARLRAIVAEDGEVQKEPIVSPRGEVLGERFVSHPAIASLRRAGKEARELCSELGLSPAGRRRLGLRVLEDPTPPDAVDALREKRAKRLADVRRAGGGA